MILDRTIEIYSRTENLAANNEGIPSFTYQLFLTIRASGQPAKLTEAQLQQWGLITLDIDSRIFYIPGGVQVPQSYLIKDLKTSLRYEIRGSNPWGHHTEILAEPYQGGAPV
jgi:hypothetical protein